MKAAILVNLKKDLIIDDIILPQNLDVGQVLIKLEYSGICGSQLGEIDGAKGEDKFLPHLLGHEGSGIVEEIGPGVKNVKVGDSVVLHWKQGDGIQASTPKYEWNGTKVNAGWVTTFNTHAIVSENRCTAIPSHISKKEAALFGCAVTTGFGVVENNARLKMGESIVIYGAGGIGLNIIQAAKLVSAWPIIAVDLHDNRLELAKKLGATHLINSRKQDARNLIKYFTKDSGLDVFIDNTGLPSIIEQGYELVNPNGRVVLVGVPKIGSNINIYSLPLHFGLSLSGSFGGECNPSRDIPRYLNLLEKGIWDLKGLITEIYELKDINYAISSMREGKSAGRVLIKL
tara:strand:- start:2491 stop:3522 length:1032 start_codon:yes stop_codon:yes gene_type:complete